MEESLYKSMTSAVEHLEVHPNGNRELRERIKWWRMRDTFYSIASDDFCFFLTEDSIEVILALSSPQIPIELLEANMCSANYLRRIAIARNTATPHHLLIKMRYDIDEYVRYWVEKRLRETVSY